MEYMSGHKLNNGLARTLPQYQAKVAKQLANVFAELQNLTFSRIGRIWCGDTLDQPVTIIPMAVWHHSPGPLETSLEYFYNQRQGQNRCLQTTGTVTTKNHMALGWRETAAAAAAEQTIVRQGRWMWMGKCAQSLPASQWDGI